MIKQSKVYIKSLGMILPVEVINYHEKIVEVYFNDNADFVPYKFDEVVLIENTGFKDKKGNSIFVGDIVERTTYDETCVYTEEVEKDYFDSSYYTVSKGSLSKLNEFRRENLEVIGNIYENDDLWKKIAAI